MEVSERLLNLQRSLAGKPAKLTQWPNGKGWDLECAGFHSVGQTENEALTRLETLVAKDPKSARAIAKLWKEVPEPLRKAQEAVVALSEVGKVSDELQKVSQEIDKLTAFVIEEYGDRLEEGGRTVDIAISIIKFQKTAIHIAAGMLSTTPDFKDKHPEDALAAIMQGAEEVHQKDAEYAEDEENEDEEARVCDNCQHHDHCEFRFGRDDKNGICHNGVDLWRSKDAPFPDDTKDGK